MHVNWMEAQYFQFSLEYFLPSLVQCVLVLEDIIPLSGQLFWILIKLSLFPLVKELPLFEHK
jgi:hypothetical protein